MINLTFRLIGWRRVKISQDELYVFEAISIVDELDGKNMGGNITWARRPRKIKREEGESR